MTQHRYSYHVFLSHNGAQKDWTRRLASRQREEGLWVFFDEDSIKLGEDIPAAIENGLKSSRHVLLVLSPEAIASSWVALEYSASLYKDPAAANRSLIPILRQDCDIPLTLGRLKHLDARGEDFERQVDHLLNGIERVEVEQTERPHRQLSSMESQEQKQEGKQGDAAPLREGARLLTLGMPVSPSTDSLYIERSVDLQARRSIEDRELLLISGPRRIGKTSLLLRAQAFAASIW